MGANGSYDKNLGGVPEDKRTHTETGYTIDGHKVLLQTGKESQTKNIMNSNTDNSVYLMAKQNEDGTLTINDEALRANSSDETMRAVKNFAGSLLRKTNQISINPMEYVDKTVVAYKNPGKSFASPYNTSQYSGMIFSGYC